MKSVTLLRQRRLTRDLEANTEPERPELPTSRTVDSEDEGVTSLTATNASSEARVKITLWRVVNTIFILGVGIAKAILAYQGYSTSPNTLDWIIGVLWASLSYWFSIMETECPDTLRSLFQTSPHISALVKWLMRAFFHLFFVFAAFLWMTLVSFWVLRLSILEGLGLNNFLLVVILSFIQFLAFFAPFCLVTSRKIRNWILHMDVRQMGLLTPFSSSDWKLVNADEEYALCLISILCWPLYYWLYKFRSIILLPGDADLPMPLMTLTMHLIGFLITSSVAGIVVSYLVLGLLRMALRLLGISVFPNRFSEKIGEIKQTVILFFTLNRQVDSSEPSHVETSSPVISLNVVAPIQTSTPPMPACPQKVLLVPATVKKPCADLLRTPASTSSSSAASSSPARNTLPTSSVMGFPIPAGSTSSSNPTVPLSPSKKSELIALLTTGPNLIDNSTTVGSIIRPRGIVNIGNMCYANSVLQLLVFCTPFQRLFAELGKILSESAIIGSSGPDSLVNGCGPLPSSTSTSSSGSTSTPINGLNGKGKEKDKDAVGMTPLVDATVEFLREFMDDKKTKSKTKKQVHSKKGSILANGGGPAVTSKGKEKETLLDGVVDDDSSGEVDWEGCDSFLPTYLYDAMKLKKRFDHMRGGHQEDAEEFFGFYLEALEEELLSLLHAANPPKSTKTDGAVEEKEDATPPEDDGWMEVGKRDRTAITRTVKATESPITRIFSGGFRTTIRAPGQKDSATVDHWNLLRLDIQRDHIHTVQDALSGISQAQSVQLTQSTRPGVIIEGQQQSLIEVLPPILVLQMKRFGYDTMGVAKVGKHVKFGPELEIGYDLMVPAAKKAHPPKYKLFGVLYHHGFSASGGHYTLDVLHPNRYPGSVNTKNREGWVRIDDELVSDMRHDNVFGAYERDDARCAYLLF